MQGWQGQLQPAGPGGPGQEGQVWREGSLEVGCTKATLSRNDQAVSNHRIGKAGKGL